MNYLKLFFILIILIFNHNLFSQISSNEEPLDYSQNLDIDLYVFSADFYFGYKEINRRNFRNIIKQNPAAHRMYLNGVKLRTFGAILGSSSVVVIGIIFVPTAYGVAERWVLPTSLASMAVGGIFYSIGRSKLKKSVEIYNQENNFGFKFGVTQNGVGVVLSF